MNTTIRMTGATLVAASFGIALATGGAALFHADGVTSVQSSAAPVVYQELTAQISTDWLAPVSARRSLDQRNEALARWVGARHGWVQVVDTASRMRTRGALGERLATPAARFDQTLLIHVPAEHAPEAIVRALEGLDVTVASITAPPPPAATPVRIEF